ncbi:hypothetical protein EKG37_21230 [Robertmurraya yapensis]|uniref:Uncharacterized protein n=3 Tax=Bacillaceae TaxID=186817 RepID=A0A431VTU9_9BACI|nr:MULTISPECIES: hypothetical protein [Bacillaceae]RTR26594.1 hypothetical protein EKG37_21230 [Bacillus yapensis]TKC15041.1 hypothetical protein FA727_19285 [Robertmurraya kyonggiensis]TKS93769.1 hypothetical protein FAR12_21235 [Bacillus yapensis]
MFNQLNLFGDQEIKVTKKEEEVKNEKGNTKVSTSTKGTKGAASTSKAPIKKPEIRVFADWTIHYYGNRHEVTEFVPDIPEEGITTETLREAMVLEFYEMEKERTHFDYDAENKRLYPKVSGGAKG